MADTPEFDDRDSIRRRALLEAAHWYRTKATACRERLHDDPDEDDFQAQMANESFEQLIERYETFAQELELLAEDYYPDDGGESDA